VPDTVKVLASCVQPTEKSVQSGTPFPPILRFSWGAHNEFTGVMTTLNAKYTMFKSNGEPTRAVCQISLTEFKQGSVKQNPTSGGRRARRSHEVVLGDTLMSVAFEEYGTPTWWRALAIENRIDNPLRLRTGTVLLIPPADEAKALR
jgi:nucleoid-associated protein YgaU